MNYKIIYYVIASLILSSCGDFLEPKSKSEFVPKTAHSLNELLLGEAYPTYESTRGSLNYFLNILDDDVACAPFQEVEVGQNRDLWWAAFSWQPNMYEKFKETGSNAGLYNIYKTFYNRILGANAVLDYIKDVNDDLEMKNFVIAQALTLRGYFYFTLVNLFGNPYYYNKDALGVPLKLTSGIENSDLSRNTVSEVYTQILEDLREAERLYKTLPSDMQWQQNYRTSLPMAQLLLSRVYLYMEDWQNAADYAEHVINDYNFYLLNLNNVEDVGSNGKPTFMNYHSYSSSEVIWTYGNIDNYTYMAAQQGKETRCIFKASDELMNCFDEQEGDLRKSRYIVREKYTFHNGAEQYNLPQAFGKVNINASTYTPTGSNLFARSFRLSEAYLNLSEAAAMLYKAGQDNKNLTKALDALNTLRNSRFDIQNYSEEKTTDPDKLISFIQRERRRELCFEDHRWFDLRRWGMKEMKHVWMPDANSTVEYTLKQNDPGFTLPLPPEALELNNKLEQNALAPTPRVN